MLLRSALYGERDKLATLFTPQLGVVRARVTSAALTDSKLGPLLMPPLLGCFTLARGHSPISIIAGIEPEDRFPMWRSTSLHIRCAGVMLAALEGLDAPEKTNREFLELATGTLNCFAERPMEGLAVFIVKALAILGLLGGEEQCSVCGCEMSSGTAAAPLDFSAFICRECYNRLYGGKEVSAIFVHVNDICKVSRIASAKLDECAAISTGDETKALIFSLAEARLLDMLPGATIALMRLLAGGNQ
jgi:DNA repair protein RecO